MANTEIYRKVILLTNEDYYEKGDKFFSTVIDRWVEIPIELVGVKIGDKKIYPIVKRKNKNYVEKRDYWV